jgi:F-type H+-transporting ATPase subunit a
MELGTELTNAISPHRVFSINLFGYELPISDTVVVMWLIMAILIIFAVIFTRKLETVPKGKQNLIETLVDLVNNIAKDNIGHHWRHFAPYLGTVLLFLAFANIISIFNVIPSGEDLYRLTHIEFFEHMPDLSFRPPTRDVNVTASLAIMSIIVVLFAGIRFKKFTGWLKSFLEPIPIILPFKILDYFIRPLSLCFRLFGNVLGAFIIMELVYVAMGLAVPAVLSIYFDLFDGILQAYIFVFLTSLYIAEAIE